MTFPALPDLTSPLDDLSAVRERLVAVRASLRKACQELDIQIQALEGLLPVHPESQPGPSLFESEPVPPLEDVAVPASPPAIQPIIIPLSEAPAPQPAPWHTQPTTNIIMEATVPTTLAPELEQATLEELNAALSKAFAQMSGHHHWAG